MSRLRSGSGDSGTTRSEAFVSRPKYTRGMENVGSKFNPHMIGMPRMGTGNCSVMFKDSSTILMSGPRKNIQMHGDIPTSHEQLTSRVGDKIDCPSTVFLDAVAAEISKRTDTAPDNGAIPDSSDGVVTMSSEIEALFCESLSCIDKIQRNVTRTLSKRDEDFSRLLRQYLRNVSVEAVKGDTAQEARRHSIAKAPEPTQPDVAILLRSAQAAALLFEKKCNSLAHQNRVLRNDMETVKHDRDILLKELVQVKRKLRSCEPC